MTDAGRRWLVVSPHIDDAVFSVGAAILANARAGGVTTIVTVLAGDPASTTPAGGWDRDSGFADAGTAARARRLEDDAACRIVGAHPVHLDGTDVQYARADEGALWETVCTLAVEHDTVFVPWSPLKHMDHRRVATEALAALHPSTDVRVYGEEPYLLYNRRAPAESTLPDGRAIRWQREPATRVDAIRKLRAVRAYRSQLRLVARPIARGGLDPAVARLLVRLYVRTRRGEWLGRPV